MTHCQRASICFDIFALSFPSRFNSKGFNGLVFVSVGATAIAFATLTYLEFFAYLMLHKVNNVCIIYAHTASHEGKHKFVTK